MATYNAGAVSDAAIAFQKPITLQQGRALRDNPIAIAEQQPGAPKIKTIVQVSGAAANTQAFTNLGDYSGLEFSVYSSSDNTGIINLEYSTNNGTTWSSAFLLTQDVDGSSETVGHFDFATALAAGIVTGGFRFSVAVTGASLAINAVRFSITGGGAGAAITALIKPNGGTV